MPLSLRRELVRKGLHIAWVAVPIAYARGLSRDVVLALLIAATVLSLAVELVRARLPRAKAGFQNTVGGLLRGHEEHRWSGATWLLISFLAVVTLFDAPTAITAMWAVAIGDAAAAVVGRALGGRRSDDSRKTIMGSTACALATMVGAAFVAGLAPAVSILAGLIAAAAEWPDGPGDDNIRIGLAVGTGILLSHMAFS